MPLWLVQFIAAFGKALAPIVRELAIVLFDEWFAAKRRSEEMLKENPNASDQSATADFDRDIDKRMLERKAGSAAGDGVGASNR